MFPQDLRKEMDGVSERNIACGDLDRRERKCWIFPSVEKPTTLSLTLDSFLTRV